jgi:hypothetical protein
MGRFSVYPTVIQSVIAETGAATVSTATVSPQNARTPPAVRLPGS